MSSGESRADVFPGTMIVSHEYLCMMKFDFCFYVYMQNVIRMKKHQIQFQTIGVLM